MQTGIVKFYVPEKGFGFIRPDDGTSDVFFHIKFVTNENFEPNKGDIASFDVFKNRDGKITAKDVSLKKAPRGSSSVGPMGEVETGTVKFFDEGKGFGFIGPDLGGEDMHFKERDLEDVDDLPFSGDKVEFQTQEVTRGFAARNIKIIHHAPSNSPYKFPVILGHSTVDPASSLKEGSWLRNWASMPMQTKNIGGGETALTALSELALSEAWDFGESAIGEYKILRSYLNHTFAKLVKESQVVQYIDKDDKVSCAAFNTGLVNDIYQPIYAFFEKGSSRGKPWKFCEFCVAGTGKVGRRLVATFSPLPQRAKYYDDPTELILDTSQEIHPQWPHIIEDAIKRNRYPLSFLRKYIPEGFKWNDPTTLKDGQFLGFLAAYAKKLQKDTTQYNNFKNRLDHAIKLAEMRSNWNYKTAIPSYFPSDDKICLFLPISLENDAQADAALVVRKEISGAYTAPTILTLEMAYNNARLVCKPDDEWLFPNKIEESHGPTDDI